MTRQGCINAGASPPGNGIGALGMLIEMSSALPINAFVCLTRIGSNHPDQIPYGNGFPRQLTIGSSLKQAIQAPQEFVIATLQQA